MGGEVQRQIIRRISVTKSDIQQGNRRSVDRCPAAPAVRLEFGEKRSSVDVSSDAIVLWKENVCWAEEIRGGVSEFIDWFDKDSAGTVWFGVNLAI